MDTFTGVAFARAEKLQEKIRAQVNQASIRYIFAPMFPLIIEPLSATIEPGAIVPISEQGQPVGEVYLMTLMREGEVFDPAQYDMRNGIGEVAINPAPIVDALLSQYGQQGMIQVKSLFNLDVDQFLSYGLNEIVFGGQEYETAEAYQERFKAVRAQAGVASSQILNRVLSELEASVNLAFVWAKSKAEWSNQALKSGDIKHFSPFEAKLFKFSGVTPIDEAMNQVAVNQAALATSLPTVITEFKEAVIASKPDYTEMGAAIAQGVTAGVQAALAAVQPAAPAAEPSKPAATEAPKPAATKNK